MQSITATDKPIFWVARDNSGNVLQSGVTPPGCTTTTGQPNLIFGTLADQIVDLEQFLGSQPAFNYILDEATKTWKFDTSQYLYIPAAADIAEPLSRALYKIIFPNRDGLYADITSHPTDPSALLLLQCRPTDIIPISLGTDPEPLRQALTPSVINGAITQQELDSLVLAVSTLAGQMVYIKDFIPASWLPYLMNRQQAVDAGYFELY